MRQPTDTLILESLRLLVRATPKNIASELDSNPAYVGERVRQLVDYGYVKPVGGGVYTLDADGYAYLQQIDDPSLQTNIEELRERIKAKINHEVTWTFE